MKDFMVMSSAWGSTVSKLSISRNNYIEVRLSVAHKPEKDLCQVQEQSMPTTSSKGYSFLQIHLPFPFSTLTPPPKGKPTVSKQHLQAHIYTSLLELYLTFNVAFSLPSPSTCAEIS